jgi:hypothetical protein
MATATIERELLDLERQYWNAMKNKDAEAAMRLTDDKCIVTGAQASLASTEIRSAKC